MVAESVLVEQEDAVARAKTELLQAFGAVGGGTARAADFARVLPGHGAEAVREALEMLASEGCVEVARLSEGTAVYHFVRP
jgi:hypothetical protein